jgi:ketosteroid isomerase-like protein
MANDEQLAKELDVLKKKVQILEDKEAIRDMLVRYAFNADLNRTENYLKLWTEDGVFATDVEGKLVVSKGKDEIRRILLNPIHQAITNRCQHLQLDYIIQVEGDTATATGYQLLTQRWEGGFGIFRCAFRAFSFRRLDGRWLIKETKSIGIGKPECQQLISTEY